LKDFSVFLALSPFLCISFDIGTLEVIFGYKNLVMHEELIFSNRLMRKKYGI